MASKKLLKARDTVLASLARLTQFVSEFTDSDDATKLSTRITGLNELWVKFDTLQCQIEETDNIPEEQKEEVRVKFEESFYDTKAAFESWLNKKTIMRGHIEHEKPQVVLPKLNIPHFSGNYLAWRSFHDMYAAVIQDNKNLSMIQKFYYLKASLEGDALKLIESIEVSESNYLVAWQSLCERYNNTQFIVNSHLKHLFEQPPMSRGSVSSLRKILTETKQHLRALESFKLPVQHWDTIIIYLILQKLDAPMRREWELNKPNSELPALKDLFQFLEQHCVALELISGQDNNQSREHNKSTRGDARASHVAASNPQNTSWTCAICNETHKIYHCDKFLKMTTTERANALQTANLCFNCFRTGCKASTCPAGSCKHCGKKHNTLIHFNKQNESSQGKFQAQGNKQPEDKPKESIEKEMSARPAVSLLNSNVTTHQVLLSTAMVQVKDVSGNYQEARALLDSASQSSFITKSLVSRLKLCPKSVAVNVSGINQSSAKVSGVVKMRLTSKLNSYQRNLECLVLDQITCALPMQCVNYKQWNIPDKLPLADQNFHQPGEIDLLLGAELFLELLRRGQIKLGVNLPILQNTVLGWIVSGKIQSSERQSVTREREGHTRNFLTVTDSLDTLKTQLTQFWNIEEIQTSIPMTNEERACETHFTMHTTRDKQGRYIVKLPLRESPSTLGDTLTKAKQRFQYLEKRLLNNQELHTGYVKFMDEYLNLNHMEEVLESALMVQPSYYIPHHAVHKEDSSSTKLRVVFDASMKSSSGNSLNDIMMVRATIQQELLSIVLRFRIHRFVFTADVVKMYRQIRVHKDHTDLQRIMWRSSPEEELKCYRLTTVTYGTASAPFLATRCLNQLAIDEREDFPLAASVVQRDFYMDDLLTGCESVAEARELQTQITNLLQRGGFELRKWGANHSELIPDLITAFYSA